MSHTKQEVFAALKGVSLARRNVPSFKLAKARPHEQSSPDCPSASPGLVLVSEQKNLLLGSDSPYFTDFPLTEDKKLKFQANLSTQGPFSASPHVLHKTWHGSCSGGLFIWAPTPLPASHALYSPSQRLTQRGNASN